MNSFLVKVWICIFAVGITLYCYVDMQNRETLLRMRIPQLKKEFWKIQEENKRLKYELESLESPYHLMELIRQPYYGHLVYPSQDEVVRVLSHQVDR